ncbi:F0F1 ATP synthase subunit epsilon [Pseudaestuariivita atlantica]|uniref:ATP synthase epsilon chain n=1 Tax=Pseudaestuariivita atlantica TaxID=1317121 RepID=A0A0L1JLH1_9RHOB|nr:F0F1 ATP synthase subunit epsilon [Pseudaestuariivita atlantica]KNG92599.1 hypothetical protein ATO11_16375 [Pseudaestuariivita atlantica]
MADTMQFDLVSPERSLASLAVTEVQIPGADGDFTAMADHAPVISTLRPGILTATGPDGSKRYAVTGGFAEVNAAGASVLAERAVPADDMTADEMATLIAAAEAAANGASGADADLANKALADLQALKAELGL